MHPCQGVRFLFFLSSVFLSLIASQLADTCQCHSGNFFFFFLVEVPSKQNVEANDVEKIQCRGKEDVYVQCSQEHLALGNGTQTSWASVFLWVKLGAGLDCLKRVLSSWNGKIQEEERAKAPLRVKSRTSISSTLTFRKFSQTHVVSRVLCFHYIFQKKKKKEA